jgi:uncharacterized repeat protein (TIGR04138 family)
MQEASFDETLDVIRAKDPRFTREAYHFVREALDHTQRTIGRETQGRVRHVTGQELLAGIRVYALTQFGPMTTTLFDEWGIHACSDFGEIVFNMVDNGLLAKTKDDSRADFHGGYDFYDAFRRPFLPSDRQSQPAPTPASSTGS